MGNREIKEAVKWLNGLPEDRKKTFLQVMKETTNLKTLLDADTGFMEARDHVAEILNFKVTMGRAEDPTSRECIVFLKEIGVNGDIDAFLTGFKHAVAPEVQMALDTSMLKSVSADVFPSLVEEVMEGITGYNSDEDITTRTGVCPAVVDASSRYLTNVLKLALMNRSDLKRFLTVSGFEGSQLEMVLSGVKRYYSRFEVKIMSMRIHELESTLGALISSGGSGTPRQAEASFIS